MPFQALGLRPSIVKAVRDAGYTEPTPIQQRAIPHVLEGHDVIGVAQTGTGKTAAFVLPILEKLARGGPAGIRVLIVAPTRELIVQIEENVRIYSKHMPVRLALVYGGVGEQPQIQALRGGAQIVLATPGRLLDLMRGGHVKFSQLDTLVLDEADRMLDMGFLPDIRRIVKALPQERQTLLFTATLSPEIESVAAEFLKRPHVVQVGKRSNPAETVTQFVYEVHRDERLSLLLHLLQDAALDSVLVFSRTKHGADKIAKKLAAHGVTTATLHSNRSQNQRLAALRSFRAGSCRVLVATDIAARGIDIEGISHVINFDFPPQPEDYVHRIGRTGRAHAVGDALSFVTADDIRNLRALEKFIGRGIPRKPTPPLTRSAPSEAMPRSIHIPGEDRAQRRAQERATPGARAPQQRQGRPQQGRPGERPAQGRSGDRPQQSRPGDRPQQGRPAERPAQARQGDRPEQHRSSRPAEPQRERGASSASRSQRPSRGGVQRPSGSPFGSGARRRNRV